jgi:type VI secretion system secreted protein Hcp
MANVYYLSVKAAKQGQLKGETGRNRTRIPILGFSYGVQSPRDPSSGLPTGRRQHKPVTVFKEWGVISPQLFEALANNEALPSVIIDEMRTSSRGIEEVYMEIRLTNASLSGIEINPERPDDLPLWTGREIEAVSFTFQKIEIENKFSKAIAMDDWEPVVS